LFRSTALRGTAIKLLVVLTIAAYSLNNPSEIKKNHLKKNTKIFRTPSLPIYFESYVTFNSNKENRMSNLSLKVVLTLTLSLASAMSFSQTQNEINALAKKLSCPVLNGDYKNCSVTEIKEADVPKTEADFVALAEVTYQSIYEQMANEYEKLKTVIPAEINKEVFILGNIAATFDLNMTEEKALGLTIESVKAIILAAVKGQHGNGDSTNLKANIQAAATAGNFDANISTTIEAGTLKYIDSAGEYLVNKGLTEKSQGYVTTCKDQAVTFSADGGSFTYKQGKDSNELTVQTIFDLAGVKVDATLSCKKN